MPLKTWSAAKIALPCVLQYEAECRANLRAMFKHYSDKVYAEVTKELITRKTAYMEQIAVLRAAMGIINETTDNETE